MSCLGKTERSKLPTADILSIVFNFSKYENSTSAERILSINRMNAINICMSRVRSQVGSENDKRGEIDDLTVSAIDLDQIVLLKAEMLPEKKLGSDCAQSMKNS